MATETKGSFRRLRRRIEASWVSDEDPGLFRRAVRALTAGRATKRRLTTLLEHSAPDAMRRITDADKLLWNGDLQYKDPTNAFEVRRPYAIGSAGALQLDSEMVVRPLFKMLGSADRAQSQRNLERYAGALRQLMAAYGSLVASKDRYPQDVFGGRRWTRPEHRPLLAVSIDEVFDRKNFPRFLTEVGIKEPLRAQVVWAAENTRIRDTTSVWGRFGEPFTERLAMRTRQDPDAALSALRKLDAGERLPAVVDMLVKATDHPELAGIERGGDHWNQVYRALDRHLSGLQPEQPLFSPKQDPVAVAHQAVNEAFQVASSRPQNPLGASGAAAQQAAVAAHAAADGMPRPHARPPAESLQPVSKPGMQKPARDVQQL